METPEISLSDVSRKGPNPSRNRSSHRLLFEAQVEVIKREIGGLEDMRERLGLSRRKISQLLMVDPSAWTRWTKGPGEAPPHIYRALQWYLLVTEKYPGLGTPYWLSSTAHGSSKKSAVSSEEVAKLKQEITEMKSWREATQTPIPATKKVLVRSFLIALFSFIFGYLLK